MWKKATDVAAPGLDLDLIDQSELLDMRAKVVRAIERSGSHVCVGLDPDPARMPVADVAEFNCAIVDATHDLVAAYKPQLAFYEALGVPGLRALEATVRHIRDVAPGVLVLADAKRGDIENTGKAYAKALFDVWDFDAATVSPYLGADAISPFLEHAGRGAFVLCWTSNAGGAEIQGLTGRDGETPYERVAEIADRLGNGGNVGLVVAPSPDRDAGVMTTDVLATMAVRYPRMPILVPGVGAQGGDAAECAKVGGGQFLINSSRGVIYASEDPRSFDQAARSAVEDLRRQISEGQGNAATR